jgi:YfiH family protein
VAKAGWRGERPEGDAAVTQAPGVICAVLTADCAPILLADPVAGVVGAAHAGWKGALGGIIGSTVEAMQGLGAEPSRMVAVIGPCIAQASYEVGADYQDRFAAEAPGSERFFIAGQTPDKRMFDLPGFVLWRLEQAGVADAAWTGPRHPHGLSAVLFEPAGVSGRRSRLRAVDELRISPPMT